MFLVDALDCPRCHGRMLVVAAVTDPSSIERMLEHLGETLRLPTSPAPAAPPGEEELESRQEDLPDPDPDYGRPARSKGRP